MCLANDILNTLNLQQVFLDFHQDTDFRLSLLGQTRPDIESVFTDTVDHRWEVPTLKSHMNCHMDGSQ